MRIGERIKARRLELGLTLEDLGKRLGKNRSTVYRYENGDIENMPIDIIKPIANALQTSPAYLMGWDQEEIDAAAEVEKAKNEYFDKYEKEFKTFMDDLYDLALSLDELHEVFEYAKYIRSKRKE